MSSHPEDPSNSEQPDPSGEEGALQGQVRHSQLSARVPADVGAGVFSNGVMILTGPYEIVLDFALRLGEQQRIAARVVLTHVVARQFIAALQDNIRNYEKRFGNLPPVPKPLPEPPPDEGGETGEASSAGTAGAVAPAGHPENQPAPPVSPHIEDIYEELKLPDEMLSGRYANAVLIRHTATEFCFDFITNVYPRSAVSARVLMSAPHVAPFLRSLTRSLSPPDAGNQGHT